MRVVASLQITSEGAVKTRKFEKQFYLGDPINIVRILNQKGAQEIAICDIEATKNHSIKFDFIKSIADELNIPLSYGGGICNLTNIEEITNLGVERLILGSCYLQDVEFTSSLSERIGKSSLCASVDILSIDYKQQVIRLAYEGKQKNTSMGFKDLFETLKNCGIGEIILKFVELDGQKNEGTMNLYYDFLTHKTVSSYLSEFQILIGAGVYSLEVLNLLERNLPIDGVVVGSLVSLNRNDGVLITYPTQYSILS